MNSLPRQLLAEVVVQSANPAAAVHFDVLEEFYQRYPDELLLYLVGRDRIDLLRRFEHTLKTNHKLGIRVFTLALNYRQVAIVKYLIGVGYRPNPIALSNAVKLGDLAMVKLLVQHLTPKSSDLSLAVKQGDREVVRVLIGHVRPSDGDLNTAIERNDLLMFELLLPQTQPNPLSLWKALRGQQPAIVEALLKAGLRPSDGDVQRLIRDGKRDFLKFVFRYIPPTRDTLSDAIRADQPEVVRLLMDRGLRPSGDDLTEAVYHRQTEVLKVIVDHRVTVPMQRQEIADLAENSGYTEISRYVYRKYPSLRPW